MRTILFVGGGSIGHIAPSIAVAHAIREQNPACALHFLCGNKKMEMDFIVAQGFALRYITLSPPHLHPILGGIIAFHHAKKVMRGNPNVIFSKGGALSGSVCLMAKLLGIPVILHESDAIMGRANALAMTLGLADTICTGFPSVSHHPHAIVTGNPVRRDIANGSRERGLALTGLTGKKPILFVLGGSQGAQYFNDLIASQLDSLLTFCDVLHVTGKNKAHASGRPGYWHAEFVQNALPDLYATANFALSRAGAGAIGELAANSVPSLLVPLRGVGHDHQYHNARALERENACIQIPQEKLTEKLVPTLKALLRSPATRNAFAQNIRKFANPNASGHIAKILLQCIEECARDA